MSDTKTPAAVLVEKMIADNEAEIAQNAKMLNVYLHEIEGRVAALRSAVDAGNSADGSWVVESANHIEKTLSQRESLHLNRRTLAHVLKAAQPAE